MSYTNIIYVMATIGVVFSIVTIVNGFRAWAKNVKEMRQRKHAAELVRTECIIPGCKDTASEDIFVMVRFKGVKLDEGLKETWKKCLCKSCARKLDGALLTTQWLHWFHIKGQDMASTGWYQDKPVQEWPK